jgi:pyruvate kinase
MTEMKIKILCTLGPVSLDGDVIHALDSAGVDVFRINLSHTPLESVEDTIALIRRYSSVPICLDTQGRQVRCGTMTGDVVLDEAAEVALTAESVIGTKREITLWPASVFDALERGARVSVDFEGAVLAVTSVGDRSATAVVSSPGRVRSNKAVTIDPSPDLPALSDTDLSAVEMGRRNGIGHYALSFATSGDEVSELRRLAPVGAEIMAKIESRAGVRNMDSIIDASDVVLIDRGDLSREIAFEYVPYYQKAIIRRANRWHRSVYVATNLLESMVTSRVPTIAEANDLATTLLDGVHGLVLAAETAIGVDPVGSVRMVLRAVRAFERTTGSDLLEEEQNPLLATW